MTSCSPGRTPSQVCTAPGPRTGTVPSPDSIFVRRCPRNFLARCLLLLTRRQELRKTGVCGGTGQNLWAGRAHVDAEELGHDSALVQICWSHTTVWTLTIRGSAAREVSG